MTLLNFYHNIWRDKLGAST